MCPWWVGVPSLRVARPADLLSWHARSRLGYPSISLSRSRTTSSSFFLSLSVCLDTLQLLFFPHHPRDSWFCHTILPLRHHSYYHFNLLSQVTKPHLIPLLPPVASCLFGLLPPISIAKVCSFTKPHLYFAPSPSSRPTLYLLSYTTHY